jgi:hypothetical protein
MPDFESVGLDRAIDICCKLVSAGMEGTVDKCVGEERILGVFGRFESLHLALSSSRGSMRVLGAII